MCVERKSSDCKKNDTYYSAINMVYIHWYNVYMEYIHVVYKSKCVAIDNLHSSYIPLTNSIVCDQSYNYIR